MKDRRRQRENRRLKNKEEQQSKLVQITFHADRQLDYGKQKFFRGGYLFVQ